MSEHEPEHNGQGSRWPRVQGLRCSMALLALLSFSVFARTRNHEFIAVDDADYVLNNPIVNSGLHWRSIQAAFSESHSSNWHPLTWISHMLDYQWFGIDAGKHHLMSAAYHALNAALCLLVFVRLSGRLWPSLLVAGLFALHPQRVESVAWVSERKDLLAGGFFFLSLLAQRNYARRPSAMRRLSVALAFGLALLCKPSVIMLPPLLVLLDRLPLPGAWTRPLAQRSWGFQLREKAPLFAMSAGSALLTLLVQSDSGAVSKDSALDWIARASNAISSYGAYIASCLLPAKLAYFYPHPALVIPDWSPWNAGAGLGLVLLIGCSLVLWMRRARWQAACLGWCWFLLLLVPMIGLVQVGEQARADRYSYLSSIGLYTLLAFGANWSFVPRTLQRLLGTLLLGAALVASVLEIEHWSDSESLFRRAELVTENNYAAALGLANIHNDRGQLAEARPWYARTLALRPAHPQALYNLALLEQKEGRDAEALALYLRALDVDPDSTLTWLNLGALHAAAGRLPQAIDAFGQVVRREAKGSPPRRQAAMNLARMGRDFQAALKSRPTDTELRKLLTAVEAALQPGG